MYSAVDKDFAYFRIRIWTNELSIAWPRTHVTRGESQRQNQSELLNRTETFPPPSNPVLLGCCQPRTAAGPHSQYNNAYY
jgi:hypothetical protein